MDKMQRIKAKDVLKTLAGLCLLVSILVLLLINKYGYAFAGAWLFTALFN